MIVTIDGPAGAGKSSAARTLARRLGFDFLDTGAMFRAVALAMLRHGVEPVEGPALTNLLASINLEMPPGRVVLNGEDVTRAIRTEEVTAASSRVAVVPAIRRHLAQRQRQIAEGHNIVCEGRDQGTAVFPDAGAKFFLIADPLERARRRKADLAAHGHQMPLEEVLRAQEERDRRDAGREVAPLRPAEDAIRVDTTALGPDEVVAVLEQVVRRRLADV